MTGWTAVIADDEAHLRDGLVRMLNSLWPELRIVGQADNGISAKEQIEGLQPDIAFLDIQMPGMTGIAVAKKISAQCRIVFITAFDQYAVQAFEQAAVDYLLKPPTIERLSRTIDRLKEQNRPESPEGLPPANIQKAIQIIEHLKKPDYLNLITVKSGSDLLFVPVSEVIFFKAEDKYTIVQTPVREYVIRTTIKTLEHRLNPDTFRRVHRNAIINITRVRAIKRSFTNQMQVVFEETKEIIKVSRAYEHLFRHM